MPYNFDMKSGFPIPQKEHYKVYVQSITYNQVPYIVDCLNGIAIQETTFPFVHHVIDDASTDGEQCVLKEWMERECDMEHAEYYDNDICSITIAQNWKNPNCTLVVYFLKKNMYGNPRKRELYKPWEEVCEYEALCEGDDYWIDSKKLQKQVDYLDGHPEVVYSCHRYNFKYGAEGLENLQENKFFDNPMNVGRAYFLFDKKYVFTQEWITKTLTCVYRINALPRDYANGYQYARDVHMVYYLLSKGNGVCHNFVGGTYRCTPNGIYAGINDWEKCDINYKVYSEIYRRTKDPLMSTCAKTQLLYAMYNGRPLGIPTNILELKVYLHLIGRNPAMILNAYFKKYHRPLN